MGRMKGLTMALVVVAGIAAVACSDSTTAPEPDGVTALRQALAPYSSFALAKSAGYSTALTDCMSNGDVGAMGIHYARPSLIDGVVDSLHPEVLIYEPGTDGQASLVGVEFIIPFAVRPASSAPPVLFGQEFMPDQTFQLWGLHVWTHRANPNGTFAMWNPRVHC